MVASPTIDARPLAEALAAEPPEPGWSLAGLLAAEPVTGTVVVACWARADAPDEAGKVELRYELRTPEGAALANPTILEEALALCAINESLEELAAADVLEQAGGALHTRIQQLGTVPEPWADALRALAQLARLVEAPVDGEVRVVTHARLDQLAGALRELDAAWKAAEHATAGAVQAERLSPDEAETAWRIFASVRQRILAVQPSIVVEQGRAAAKLHAREARATMIVRSR